MERINKYKTILRESTKKMSPMFNFFNTHANCVRLEAHFQTYEEDHPMIWTSVGWTQATTYQKTLLTWKVTREVLLETLKEAIGQSGVDYAKCAIVLKGGNDNGWIKDYFPGERIDLNTLFCPN